MAPLIRVLLPNETIPPMKIHASLAASLLACAFLASCDDSSTAPNAQPAPSGPGILGTWEVDTMVNLAGLPTDVFASLVVKSDSTAIDTLNRYNSDGGDVEDLFWTTRRTWTAVGNDVVLTKTSCRRTDFFGDWATISCLTPTKDTVVGGMLPGLSSFKLRARESNLGILTFHKK